MAANKSQGSSLTLFMIGFTATGAGLYLSSGMGKVVLVIGLALLAFSLWNFFLIKPLEGKVALKSQPAAIKLLGIAVNLAGWLIAVFSLHITKSTGGRMIGAIIGIAVCLASLVFVLPTACNKNAIWKA